MKNIFALILISISILSCSDPIKKVEIDNPTEEKLTLIFNGNQTVEIDPLSSRKLDIKFGKGTISVNGNQAEEIDLNPELNYLINPSHETYYVEEAMFFTSEAAQNEYYRYNKPESEVEGFTIGGYFEKIEGQVAIPVKWKYGLDEQVGTAVNITTSQMNKTYHSVKKVYRKKDLLDKFKSEMKAYTDDALEKLFEKTKSKKHVDGN